jgi:mRNA interferase MazF
LGSIWIVTFDPSVGTEIKKTRPALVVSGSLFNAQRSKITVIPFTSAKVNDPKISPALVRVSASVENGLAVDSLLVCIDPITFDKIRLIKKLGVLETNLLQQAQNILRQYLEI